MSKGIGRLLQAGIARETTRGTAIAAASYYIPFSSAVVDEKEMLINNEEAIGVIEDSINASIAKVWSEVSITAPIADKHFPLLLYSALGTLNSATKGGETIVYDHTITVAQSAQHQSLTIFLDDPLGGQDYKHALGVMRSLEINYELDKFIDYVAQFNTKKGATATLTPSLTSENRFLPHHTTFKLATDLAGLDAASATSIKSMKLTIEKNVEDNYVLGSQAPADFLNKQFTITGEVTLYWQNESDFKTQFVAGSAKAMRIDLVNNDVTIGNSSNPRVKIDLAKAIITELSRPIEINDIVMQTVSFKAHYSTGDTKMITCLCNNLVASY